MGLLNIFVQLPKCSRRQEISSEAIKSLIERTNVDYVLLKKQGNSVVSILISYIWQKIRNKSSIYNRTLSFQNQSCICYHLFHVEIQQSLFRLSLLCDIHCMLETNFFHLQFILLKYELEYRLIYVIIRNLHNSFQLPKIFYNIDLKVK